MFTGLAEEAGNTTAVEDEGPDSKRISLRASVVTDDAASHRDQWLLSDGGLDRKRRSGLSSRHRVVTMLGPLQMPTSLQMF